MDIEVELGPAPFMPRWSLCSTILLAYNHSMTPTAIRLKHRLEQRVGWFRSQWLFKWHHIGRDRPVEIDMFDGRNATYSGIAFCGSTRLIFWDAVTRGTRREIVEQFAWVDSEVRRYNHETALKAIDECAMLLVGFANTIRQAALEKDRILRGDGVNFPAEQDAGQWHGTSRSEIEAQAAALKAALPREESPPPHNLTRRERLNAWWHSNQWWAGPVGWLAGLASIVAFFV